MTEPVKVEINVGDVKALDALLTEIRNPKVTFRADNDGLEYRKEAEEIRIGKIADAKQLLYKYLRNLP